MRVALPILFFATSCAPHLNVTIHSPAKVPLGPVTRVAILTFDTRLGLVMRERIRHELSRDGYFTLSPMCGDRSCETVDAFIRVHERQVTTVEGPAASVTVDSDVASPDGRSLTPVRHRSRVVPLNGETTERVTERVASELAAEIASELLHPRRTEALTFDDGAPFKLGIRQALDGRLCDATKTFEEMILNNPKTAGAFFNLAIVLEASGDFSGAKANYDRAIALTDKRDYLAGREAFNRRQKVRREVLTR